MFDVFGRQGAHPRRQLDARGQQLVDGQLSVGRSAGGFIQRDELDALAEKGTQRGIARATASSIVVPTRMAFMLVMMPWFLASAHPAVGRRGRSLKRLGPRRLTSPDA